MKWKNLKENLCPMCGSVIKLGGLSYQCSGCDFRISTDRFKEITQNTLTYSDWHLKKIIAEDQKAENEYYNNPDF